ncbi:sigma-70 family RNA polymerase sigma factor [Vulgatibacter incomptus]|uniref:RNA polymerase sigma factor n=1 Tax=Vulgatibacter incomptus TaxID=1391653 RepID=A0A0K1PI01_9BACT|nr:sigma-70 family RNA polymerase sigma factor [Vulgatibacter incomptus]AKU93155.1 RNA polymerase sigma factor [Vulgatibacter incomptus]
MSLPAAQLEEHRTSLTGLCYRMLGSVVDADDAVQETMVRAWRSLDRFDGRSSMRTWLHRIATNVCLDALAAEKRRARPMEEGPVGSMNDDLEQRPRTHWLEPVPDAAVIPDSADPAERAMLRQSIRLAFVAALQHLPPRQRAALLLTEVLGWSVAEVADCLDTSVPAVNSALQRARATLATRDLQGGGGPLSDSQTRMLERYVAAFERFDVAELTSLLREDATFSMPPYALWLQGPELVRQWLLGPGAPCKGSRLLPTWACGAPAFGQYRPGEVEGTWRPWALVVLELDGDRIAGWNSFLDTEVLFPKFGLPPELA